MIYLASRSPRRRELLAQIGIAHRVLEIDVDETRREDERPRDYVLRIAREKALAGRARLAPDAPEAVLGADTAVVLGDRTLGKPGNARDAARMLEALSGREHRVLTGVALATRAGVDVRASETAVRFRAIEPAERDAYCATGEPLDKAGAYGIQGAAAIFVEDLRGSYTGVVGLPLFETAGLLAAAGIEVLGAGR